MLLRMPQMPQALTLSPLIRNYGINLGAPYRASTSLHQLQGQPCVMNLHCVCVCVCGGGGELL